MQNKKTTNEFQVIFDGQLNQIDAQTLISSLISVSTIIQEANTELNTGKRVDVKIKALAPGSFEIHFELLGTALAELRNLFTNDNIQVSAAIITIMVGALELHKFLKGESPKGVIEEGDQIKIEKNDGSVTFVNRPTYNTYINPPVQDAISGAFKSIREEPAVEELKIEDCENKTIFVAEQDDFKDMAKKPLLVDSEKKVEIKEKVELIIFKLVFDTGYKWQFYFQGAKISADMMDEAFFEKIDAGVKFAKGDVLIANLRINKKYEASIGHYINESYEVVEVLEHIPRSSSVQLTIDSENIDEELGH